MLNHQRRLTLSRPTAAPTATQLRGVETLRLLLLQAFRKPLLKAFKSIAALDKKAALDDKLLRKRGKRAAAAENGTINLQEWLSFLTIAGLVDRSLTRPVKALFPRPIPPRFPVLARACLWCLVARMWRVNLP